ncbi:hypothetical protein JMG10_32670 [Nostoc ellipsosporum NOK]|nr:hypothetical protein [Nostoc ellipsosporum NOK]
MQTTSHILMIRPVRFGFNAQTAVNNAFQQVNNDSGVQEKAQQEFDRFVALLRGHGVDVTVIDDTTEPHTPDSIFPNNWVSFHHDGSVILYPMFAENRRLERKPHVIDTIASNFRIDRITDLSELETKDIYLEGTGSMVLDRTHKIAYACLSPRTHPEALKAFADATGYETVVFHAADAQGVDIYHTNVLMCVGEDYAVICLDAIPSEEERKMVEEKLTGSRKTVVTITLDQMNHFAGNMLQVQSLRGRKLLVMSTQAFSSLTPEQITQLSAFNPIVHAPLDIIEKNGGGSARCMMAEIHLPTSKA